MSRPHVMLGVLVATLWGLNFVAARIALEQVSPLLLVALRFGVASLPAFFFSRPAVAWSRLAAIASTLFIGQFAFLFWGMKVGAPRGQRFHEPWGGPKKQKTGVWLPSARSR